MLQLRVQPFIIYISFVYPIFSWRLNFYIQLLLSSGHFQLSIPLNQITQIIMTFLPLLLLPLGSLAAPQFGGGGIFDGDDSDGGLLGGLGGIGDLIGEPMEPESVSDLEPEIRADAQRTLTRWGPIQMAGHDVCFP